MLSAGLPDEGADRGDRPVRGRCRQPATTRLAFQRDASPRAHRARRRIRRADCVAQPPGVARAPREGLAHRRAAAGVMRVPAPSASCPTTWPSPTRCCAVARVSRLHLRPLRRRQPGRALLARGQPAAGGRLAGRAFEYADESLQRVTEETPFTVADFALCDTRYAGHFARVPRERWNAAMIPGRRVARARSEGRRRRDPVRARRRPRRRAAAGDRRHPADADRRALPDLLAPAPGAGRHPQLARGDPARAREGEVGAGEGDRSSTRSRPPRRARRRRPRRPPPLPDAAPPAPGGAPPSPRRRSATRTRRGSIPRAARAATSARTSTTRCSSTTTTSRPTSSTSSSAPIGSWSRPPRSARWRSSVPASRGTRTSRARRARRARGGVR